MTLINNDEELPYICPLIDKNLKLNKDFIKATYTAWAHLLHDPLIFDLVEMDSQLRRERLGKDPENLL